jgi:hypothetical protein
VSVLGLTNCQNCGSPRGCGESREKHNGEQCGPSCISAPSHCGECPPWRCEECGEMDAPPPNHCKCWTTFEGMAPADIRGLFAASGFDTSAPYPTGESDGAA